ncbi:MAG: hypothetical protein E7647_02850 [Ruminococcaceae bacterium]|nr:hypothetical protein [Oscillospiraceae bacterium]
MKNSQSKTKQLTLGAILLAVFVILHIIIPGGQKVIQGVLMILTFLPVTIYSLSCGVKKTLVMAAAGCAICALLLTPEVLLSYAIPALLIGIAGGICYGKCKRLTVILVFSVMQLIQNITELLVYYFLMKVDFKATYLWAVGLVYEKIPAEWLQNALFASFFEDLMICCVPCLLIMGAGAKGILSFQMIRLVHKRLSKIMGPEPEAKYTEQTKFSGGGISVAYLCVESVCTAVAILPFLKIVPYHFVSAAAAAVAILLGIIYLYYFYSIRVRTNKEHTTRLIYSFVLVALLPINLFALPIVEINLLKKESSNKE